jgi:inner membrane protein
MSTLTSELWSKGKLLVKVGVICFTILLLLIPMNQVSELVREREERHKEAVAEISSKWASAQTIKGPVLVIPYWQTISVENQKAVRQKQYAYFMPSTLKASCEMTPIEKHRGLYKVMLYSSVIKMNGTFNDANIEALNIPAQDMIWNEAFVRVYLSDMRGLNKEVVMNWKDTALSFGSAASPDPYKGEGLTAPIKISDRTGVQNVTFSSEISLSGSQQLFFAPLAQSTDVTISSKWPHPSFAGDILPQQSDVKASGFTANWKFLGHRRNFPQQFTEDANAQGGRYNLSSNQFGVDLFVPVNTYQKTMRSVKYAILCIVLTFAAFFLIEMVNKKSVHPFQYVLIGLALVIFYTLLLSISEYTGFNIAYLIASVCTIGLTGWFVRGVLQSSRLSFVLSAVMLLMYTYIFTILQLQDFALILGSVGLFITLGVIMYFTRKIQW